MSSGPAQDEGQSQARHPPAPPWWGSRFLGQVDRGAGEAVTVNTRSPSQRQDRPAALSDHRPGTSPAVLQLRWVACGGGLSLSGTGLPRAGGQSTQALRCHGALLAALTGFPPSFAPLHVLPDALALQAVLSALPKTQRLLLSLGWKRAFPRAGRRARQLCKDLTRGPDLPQQQSLGGAGQSPGAPGCSQSQDTGASQEKR